MLARILNTLLMLAVAVSITGVINRTRAVLAGRKGLRFFQHLFDAKVLLGKGAVYSPTTGILFRLAPCVCLASSLAAFLFIPVADLDPLLSFDGDVVMVAYLLALSRVSLILAALDTGSSFEGMGASRERCTGADRACDHALYGYAGHAERLYLAGRHILYGTLVRRQPHDRRAAGRIRIP